MQSRYYKNNERDDLNIGEISKRLMSIDLFGYNYQSMYNALHSAWSSDTDKLSLNSQYALQTTY